MDCVVPGKIGFKWLFLLCLIVFEGPLAVGNLQIPPSASLDLQKIPVLARKDAKEFRDQIPTFLGDEDLKKNPYSRYFQGVIFGESFQILSPIEIESSLKAALASLWENTPTGQSREYLLLGNLLTSPGKIQNTGDRRVQRTEFQTKLPLLNNLSEQGNNYALFVEGLLNYDAGFDQGAEGVLLRKAGIRSLMHAASYHILPAVGFMIWYEKCQDGRASYETEDLFFSLRKMQETFFDPHLFISLFIRKRFHQSDPFSCRCSCLQIKGRDHPKNYVSKLKASLFLSFSEQDKEYYGKTLKALIEKYCEDPTRRIGKRFFGTQILAPLAVLLVSLYTSFQSPVPTDASSSGYASWFFSTGLPEAFLSASTLFDNCSSWFDRVAFAGLDYKEAIEPEFKMIALFYALSSRRADITPPERAQDIFEVFSRSVWQRWIRDNSCMESFLRCLRLRKPSLSQEALIYEEKYE